MRKKLSVARMISLACSKTPGWPAAEQCCAALRDSGVESIEASLVDRAHLLRIYEIRLARKPNVVVGADRLLSDLRSCSEDRLFLVALKWQGRGYCLLVDPALTELVACFVGTDRRYVPVLWDALRARPDLEAGTPLPLPEIDAAVCRLGNLPDDYRAFLADFGWVSAGPHEVFGLGVDIPPYLDVVRVNESEWTEGRLPRHLVAVMNDGGGNLSCIDTTAVSKGDGPAIVLWDHEVSPIEGPIPLASTFSDLLANRLLARPQKNGNGFST
jgi:SMI1-KNR4 cell-wall